VNVPTLPAAIPFSDPAQILRYRDRQYAAELLAVAILDLDLFTWLDAHPGATSADLNGALGLAERPADVLLTLCRANGLVQTGAGGRHYLTVLGREHLVRHSPWFLGPYYEPIRDTPITRSYREVLRSGRPGNWQAQAEGADWHASMLDPEFARGFTALMNCRGLALGQALARALGPYLAGRRHVLDVGGGSGIYAVTLAAAHPELRATVLEQPPVDGLARGEIARHGLTSRIAVTGADMFRDPWPEGTDVVLFSNVLHDWDVEEVRALLARAAAALPSDGLLVIHDAFVGDDKDGPLPVAEYSALLMNITQGKCYSAREYAGMLDPLGFRVGTFRETIADRGFLVAVKGNGS
jgi:predicted nicotinamide N-methyase